MFYEAKLLKPWQQLLKIFLIPIVAAYSFLLWVFLSGQYGRYKYKTPVAIELGVSWVWISILIIVLVVLVYILKKLILSSPPDYRMSISIKQEIIEVYQEDKAMTFYISSAEKIKYKTSWIWTRIFLQKFYRAGLLSIKYEGTSYLFYFQVVNNGIEDKLKKKFTR